MKQVITVPCICLLLVSCTGQDRGAIDPDTLAKKMFDAVRNNAEPKSELLLPDKGTYRKIETEMGREPADLDQAYSQFLEYAAAAFADANAKSATWEQATYTRSNFTESKLEKLPVERITIKFMANNEPLKMECSAIKFNNRWYYYGDIVWLDKPE